IPAIESQCFVSCVNDYIPTLTLRPIYRDIVRVAECFLNPDSPNCEEIVVTGIMVDSIYGSVYGCEEGNCMSKVYDTYVAGLQGPGSDERFAAPGNEDPADPNTEPFFVQTACAVRLNESRIEEVP